MARTTGLEPATTGVTGRYSNRLSYVPALGREVYPRRYGPASPFLAALGAAPVRHHLVEGAGGHRARQGLLHRAEA